MGTYLSAAESAAVFDLAENLTGTCQDGAHRREVLLQNVCRRITVTGAGTLRSYLAIVEGNPDEYQQLISALSIHTTSWFREESHFQKTWLELAEAREYSVRQPLMVFSAACSIGKEVYSFALMLEEIRASRPNFDYQIVGIDIDPVSIQTASRGIYPAEEAGTIPQKYRPMLCFGKGSAAGFFTLNKEVRKRCSFHTEDLRSVGLSLQQNETGAVKKKWDLIICRNVLIYFHQTEVAKIVQVFRDHLDARGILCLGHSEAIDGKAFGLKGLGNAIYRRIDVQGAQETKKKCILVVDDSAVVRRVMAGMFRKEGFEVHEAASAAEATKFIQKSTVDLITLDLNMPGQDGLSWLKEQRLGGMRIPVIIVSDAAASQSAAVLGALERGAQDVVEKRDLHEYPADVIARASALIDQSRLMRSGKSLAAKGSSGMLVARRPEIIVVGASTGGTEALTTMLRNVSRNCPPIVVVQHITHGFSKAFALRLAEEAGLPLGNTTIREVLREGMIYLSDGDYHIGVKRKGDGQLEVFPSDAALVERHRPSVDFLFNSTAHAKASAVGILLTGMGRDGAEGLLELRKSGSQTMAQNEESCVVFGMPREAIQRGAAQFVGDLYQLRKELDVLIGSPVSRIKLIS